MRGKLAGGGSLNVADGGAIVAPVPASVRPVVTLTTDFGTRDAYVAALKAVMLRRCPDLRMIDVTHEVPRHDILCGSITLERAVDGFLPGTIHLAVVDPGVGTDRRILITELNGQLIVCPDNGLITWSWRRLGPGRAHELTWRPQRTSATFHGRDIMAPPAVMLAGGTPLGELSRPIDDPILLDIKPATRSTCAATIIHIDAFGNATTNMPHQEVAAIGDSHVVIGRRNLGPLRRTYGDVAPGQPLALIGSSGLLEIAVRDGSAADELALKVGDQVLLEPTR